MSWKLGFAFDDNGNYRFLAPMHRFLDVCLSVQQDRDVAASLLSNQPTLISPDLVADDSDDELAQAIAAEQAALEEQA